MKFNFRTFFLKSIPYLMSITGGIILYTGAIDNAPNANIRDLVINVSASLLSIPLVFLLYDYMNYRVSTQMKRTLVNTMSDKINTLMLNLIVALRESMGVRTKLNLDSLNKMLTWRAGEISRRLKLTTRIIDNLHTYHNDLDTLLYRNGQTNVLDSDQTQILSALARDISRLINENKFHKRRRISAKYIENIMSHILDWLDVDSVSALNLAHHISDDPSGTTSSPKK